MRERLCREVDAGTITVREATERFEAERARVNEERREHNRRQETGARDSANQRSSVRWSVAQRRTALNSHGGTGCAFAHSQRRACRASPLMASSVLVVLAIDSRHASQVEPSRPSNGESRRFHEACPA